MYPFDDPPSSTGTHATVTRSSNLNMTFSGLPDMESTRTSQYRTGKHLVARTTGRFTQKPTGASAMPNPSRTSVPSHFTKIPEWSRLQDLLTDKENTDPNNRHKADDISTNAPHTQDDFRNYRATAEDATGTSSDSLPASFPYSSLPSGQQGISPPTSSQSSRAKLTSRLRSLTKKPKASKIQEPSFAIPNSTAVGNMLAGDLDHGITTSGVPVFIRHGRARFDPTAQGGSHATLEGIELNDTENDIWVHIDKVRQVATELNDSNDAAIASSAATASAAATAALQARVDAISSERDDALAQAAQNAAQHATDMAKLRDDHDRLRSLFERKSKAYDLRIKEIARLQDLAQSIASDGKDRIRDVANLKSENERLRNSADDAGSLREENASLRDGNATLRDHIATLRDEIAALRNEADQRGKRFAKQLAKAVDRTAAAEKARELLKWQYKNLLLDHEQEQRAKVRLEYRNSDLKEALEDRGNLDLHRELFDLSHDVSEQAAVAFKRGNKIDRLEEQNRQLRDANKLSLSDQQRVCERSEAHRAQFESYLADHQDRIVEGDQFRERYYALERAFIQRAADFAHLESVWPLLDAESQKLLGEPDEEHPGLFKPRNQQAWHDFDAGRRAQVANDSASPVDLDHTDESAGESAGEPTPPPPTQHSAEDGGMTSGFFMPDITLHTEDEPQAPAPPSDDPNGKGKATAAESVTKPVDGQHTSGRAPSSSSSKGLCPHGYIVCLSCKKEERLKRIAREQKQYTRVEPVVPVSDRDIMPRTYEEDVTFRPVFAPAWSLDVVANQIRLEAAKLGDEIVAIQKRLNKHDDAIDARGREKLEKELVDKFKQRKVKCRQVYKLQDVREGQSKAGQRTMAQAEVDATLNRILNADYSDEDAEP